MYKIGQKLVCLIGVWRELNSGEYHYDGPRRGQIVEVEGYGIDNGLYLVGYNSVCTDGKREEYDPKYFRPLLGNDAKESLVRSFIEIKETSDSPIQIPETV